MNEDALIIRLGYINKDNGIHQSYQIYDKEGVCPTLMARDYKDPIKYVVKVNKKSNE